MQLYELIVDSRRLQLINPTSNIKFTGLKACKDVYRITGSMPDISAHFQPLVAWLPRLTKPIEDLTLTTDRSAHYLVTNGPPVTSCGPTRLSRPTSLAHNKFGDGDGIEKSSSGSEQSEIEELTQDVHTRLTYFPVPSGSLPRLEPPPVFDVGANLRRFRRKMCRYLSSLSGREHSVFVLDRISERLQDILEEEGIDDKSPVEDIWKALETFSEEPTNAGVHKHTFWWRVQMENETVGEYAAVIRGLVHKAFGSRSRESREVLAMERLQDGLRSEAA
ncbi:unnamed protein product [Echinostoma caproni]|uniref:Uncharacterized protein n=1 Tax=Echinostoma caproni TaxID=27848 RepID=A0A3P8CW38_9TREM|nr:unnamed protein product [Echinostoma caproni]